MSRHRAIVLLTIVFAATLPGAARADWVQDGVLTAAGSNYSDQARLASDGAGGAIVVWLDTRNASTDIYAQRIDAYGNPRWQINGVPVCTAVGSQTNPQIVTDGSGGAFIVWTDYRSGVEDLYAQRVGPAGTRLWANNGVPVCSATGIQNEPSLVFDGFALLVSWTDSRSGVGDIYVQRVDGNGASLWAANGVAVCTATGVQYGSHVASDDAAGAIVTWTDYRLGNWNVYAQLVNFFGTPSWNFNGVGVATSGVDEVAFAAIADGSSGIIIGLIVNSFSLAVQRLNAAGAGQWGPTGKGLFTGSPYSPGLISDGAGGLVVAWGTLNTYFGCQVQHVNSSGTATWGGGAPSQMAWNQELASVASDGDGGVVLLMRDDRTPPSNDLYMQRVDATGHERWIPGGVPVNTAPGPPSEPTAVLGSDGGILTSCADSRSNDVLVYTQRIETDYGWWGRPEPTIISAIDVPGDQGGEVVLSWTASERDNVAYQVITHYTEWRALDVLSVSPESPAARRDATSAGNLSRSDVARTVTDRYGASTRLVTLDEVGPDFTGPAVRVGELAGVTYLWELVGSQAAIFSSGYSDVVATRQDSVGGDPAKHYFQVVAHTEDPFVLFASPPDSGYSVDNIAPAPPLVLAAMRSGGANVDLDWSASGANEPDFKEYWIYRGAASGFPVDPAHFLASTPDTMTTDGSAAPASAWYYRAVSVDVHGNQSDPSNEAMVNATSTAVGTDTPALTRLQVTANVPNPFGRYTEVEFGMPAPGRVSISVYDVAGRRVYEREAGEMGAGWHRAGFEGLDSQGRPLASGVYFYRVSVGGEVATHKIVIRR